MRELKIGTSWVRGVVGGGLTPELIVDFACAFGTWCDGGPVVVGRDTRRSSSMLHASVTAGLISTGCEIIDLGVCPTALVSFGIRELGAAGGISITGSHNDVRWNALKFIGPDGALLNAVKSEELLDIYHASAFRVAPWRALRRPTTAPETLDRYLECLLSAVDAERIRPHGFRVAVDFCNGACGPATERFLDALGCTLLPINDEPSGEFAHAPAPNPTNMRQLATLMRALGADLGVAMNVDGDRVGFVTADGVPLSEEYALPLAAQHRLAWRPGPIVTNLSTSRMVDAVAKRHNQPVLRTFVGEGYVVDRGIAEGAVLAGEGSGGIALLPISMTYDSLPAMGLVLEAMAVSGRSLAELAGRLRVAEMRKGELACPADLVFRVMEGFRTLYGPHNPDFTDGVRVEWPDAWLHVRASKTEPILRVIVEAETAQRADALYDEAMALARRRAFSHGGP